MEPKKGDLGGECNRTVCHRAAAFFNLSTRKYYCSNCAFDIQDFENTQKEPAVIFEKFWRKPK